MSLTQRNCLFRVNSINLALFFVVILLGIQQVTYAKNIIAKDTLSSLSYSKLYHLYKLQVDENQKLALVYAQTYLNKAKNDNDKIKKIQGYHYVSNLSNIEYKIQYLDSAISLMGGSVNYVFPAKSYLYKGYGYYKERKFKKAIDNLLIANKLSREKGNSDLVFYSNYMIAILTDRIGNHKDAINILNEYIEYIKQKKITKTDTTLLLNTYHALAISYYKEKKIDSSMFYNKMGYNKAIESNKNLYKNLFSLSSGVALYHDNNYSKALDSINSSLKYFIEEKSLPDLAVAYYYMGKILYDTQNKEKAVSYLKQVDSIFDIQNDILPETRETYLILKDYYKITDSIKKQLYYTEKLVAVDKVLNENYKHLQTNIIKDYYTPILVTKKLNEKNSTYYYIIYGFVLVSTFALFGWILNYRKQIKYKNKFENLLKNKEFSGKKNTKEIDLSSLNIPQETIDKIISEIKKFEGKKNYLNSNCTLSSLAKDFKTNSLYLSKIINAYTNKNFSNYINDLRINYTVSKLKEDKQFRKYSIKAISQEVGFKNSESFSKSFYKNTGIYPSYFIKKLEEI